MSVINGRKSIARALGVSEPTIDKYINEYGLPVSHLYDSPCSPIVITESELDEWVKKRPHKKIIKDKVLK